MERQRISLDRTASTRGGGDVQMAPPTSRARTQPLDFGPEIRRFASDTGSYYVFAGASYQGPMHCGLAADAARLLNKSTTEVFFSTAGTELHRTILYSMSPTGRLAWPVTPVPGGREGRRAQKKMTTTRSKSVVVSRCVYQGPIRHQSLCWAAAVLFSTARRRQ